jgi:hypothetical protein
MGANLLPSSFSQALFMMIVLTTRSHPILLFPRSSLEPAPRRRFAYRALSSDCISNSAPSYLIEITACGSCGPEGGSSRPGKCDRRVTLCPNHRGSAVWCWCPHKPALRTGRVSDASNKGQGAGAMSAKNRSDNTSEAWWALLTAILKSMRDRPVAWVAVCHVVGLSLYTWKQRRILPLAILVAAAHFSQ